MVGKRRGDNYYEKDDDTDEDKLDDEASIKTSTPQQDLTQPIAVGARLKVYITNPGKGNQLSNQLSFQVVLKLKGNNSKDNGPEIHLHKFIHGCITPKGISLQDYLSNYSVSDSLKILFIKDLLWEVGLIHNDCIIHNDIKPHNIIVYREYGNLCRLIDYEFSKTYDVYYTDVEECYYENKRVESREGTERYYPPEKEASGFISPKSDIYSLGLVFCDILLGLTRSSDHPSKQLKLLIKQECERLNLPKLGSFIVKMISKEKGDRPYAEDIVSGMEWGDFTRVDIIETINNKIEKARPIESRNIFGKYVDRKMSSKTPIKQRKQNKKYSTSNK